MDPQTSQPVSYNSGAGPGRSLLFTVLLAALLVISLVFGGWAFKNMQDYKNNSNKKTTTAVNSAVAAAKQAQKAQDDQDNKSPNKVFQGSATYGSIRFDYPKTWSGYVDTTSSSEPINAYFHPDVVPGIQSKTAFALRVELLSTDYSQVVQQLSSQIQQGTVTAKAYLPPKLNGVTNVQPGTLFSGQVNSQDNTQRGTLLAIKVRDKTLEISTQSNDYLSDFNNTVLSSLSFAP
jgi:hypothetical protein